jgi:hypothetical protein
MNDAQNRTSVLVHGACWLWKRVRDLLGAAGHRVPIFGRPEACSREESRMDLMNDYDADSSNSTHKRDLRDRDHDQWYSSLFLGIGVMLLSFATLLMATWFL